jgi:hypothetical protein
MKVLPSSNILREQGLTLCNKIILRAKHKEITEVVNSPE